MEQIGFRDLETSEVSGKTTSNIKEGVSGLLKDNDWTADKPDILHLSESSLDVNNKKVWQLFH